MPAFKSRHVVTAVRAAKARHLDFRLQFIVSVFCGVVSKLGEFILLLARFLAFWLIRSWSETFYWVHVLN